MKKFEIILVGLFMTLVSSAAFALQHAKFEKQGKKATHTELNNRQNIDKNEYPNDVCLTCIGENHKHNNKNKKDSKEE